MVTNDCRATTARWLARASLRSHARQRRGRPRIVPSDLARRAHRAHRHGRPARADGGVSPGSALGRPVDRGLSSRAARHDAEPVVMVCNFRPGFALGAPGERVVHLSEMSARQTREQLVSLLDGADPPEELIAVVTARTDGNPFFVEEIVNSLIETDVLVREADGWVLATGARRCGRAEHDPRPDRGAHRQPRSERRRVLREARSSAASSSTASCAVCRPSPRRSRGSLADLAAADLIRERSRPTRSSSTSSSTRSPKRSRTTACCAASARKLHERVAAGDRSAARRPHRRVRRNARVSLRTQRPRRRGGEYLRRAGRKALDRYAPPRPTRTIAPRTAC